MKRPPLWLLLVVCAAAIPWLQTHVDRSLGSFRAQEEVLYLWKGEHVKRLIPGFEGLMADIYWIRTVQYYGGQRMFAKEKRFDLLEPLIDITVTLDPTMDIAYRYGAIFLADRPPWGAGLPERAAALLERGARALPHSWFIHQLRGYLLYAYLQDSERAAAALLEASRLPGAPWWLETSAAAFLTKGGEREKSRALWKTLYERFEEEPLKENAKYHLQQLDALDQVDAMNHAVERFERMHGRKPRSLEELKYPFVPVDPEGVPFVYDAAQGKVKISRRSTLSLGLGLLEKQYAE